MSLDWMALVAGLVGVTAVVTTLFYDDVSSVFARTMQERAVHASSARVHRVPPDARHDPDAPSTKYAPRTLAPREVLLDAEDAELGDAEVGRSDAGRKAFEHDLAEPERPDEPTAGMRTPQMPGDAAHGPGLEGVTTGCLAESVDEPADRGWIGLLAEEDTCGGS